MKSGTPRPSQKKKVWGLTEDPSGAMFKSESPQDVRHFLDEDDAAMTVTMNAMEVKTFLVTLASRGWSNP